jgi:membrane fusion protein (multidrug efflux system)
MPPPTVTVVPVVESQVTPTFEFVGRTVAVESVDLRARVQGFLESRNFEEGAEVKKGDLLFVIERAPYQAAVDQAAAALARAQATLVNARSEVKRLRPLQKKELVTASDLDAAVATELEADASVKEAQANLRSAQLDLGYTEIHAPVSGRIGRSAYSVGNLVGADSGVLASIVSLDPIYVTFPVSERDLMTTRQEALARTGAFPTRAEFIPTLRLSNDRVYEHKGAVEFLDNRIDEATGTVTARASFPNPDKLLLPGQFVTVLVERDVPTAARLVPQAAIQQDQAGYYVLVVDEQNRVATRRITVGEQRDADWIVKEGLEVGEQVVFEGLQKVRPGVEVKATRVEPPKPVEG